MLPDDVLLLIFLFDGLEDEDVRRKGCLPWQRLVHVCQRWRYLVFSSPKFLDLRLFGVPWTRRFARGKKFTSAMTAIWPPLPVIIRGACYADGLGVYDFNAAIVDPTRVREIDLELTRSPLEELDWAMQKPFPTLTYLRLCLNRHMTRDLGPGPALSDEFLGGSALNLQYLELDGIVFPALPKFLLSATGLVRLTLSNILRDGYVSPEAMVTRLALMVKLKWLTIDFRPSIFFPDSRPPPPTRTILPALTHFVFRGAKEYLEDFVSRIDAPLLHDTRISFYYQLIFDIPQLTQFMRRTTRFEAFNQVLVDFDYLDIHVGNFLPTRDIDDDEISTRFMISAESYTETDPWNLSLAQFFTSVFPFISMVKRIYIDGPEDSTSYWRANLENTEWLEIFYPFTALEDLYLYNKFALHIAPALQKLVEGRVTEVLPTLQNIYLEGVRPSKSGPIQEVVEKFVTARQLSGRPVTVSLWKRKSLSDSDSDSDSDDD